MSEHCVCDCVTDTVGYCSADVSGHCFCDCVTDAVGYCSADVSGHCVCNCSMHIVVWEIAPGRLT